MLFYLDENVPASVQDVLSGRGHEVRFTRELLPIGSPDELVATASEFDEAILVSHDSDFKKIAQRIPDGQKSRFRKLSMVRMQCTKPRSAQRLEVALPYIEFEFDQRKHMHDKRMIVVVKTDLISIAR